MSQYLPFVLVLATSAGRRTEYRATVLPLHKVPPRGTRFCGKDRIDKHFVWSHFTRRTVFDCPAKAARAAMDAESLRVETYTVHIEHFPNEKFRW